MLVDDEAGNICVPLPEGGVWVCIWDAGRVVRYDADGAVTRVVVGRCRLTLSNPICNRLEVSA
jgi:hypothetical protein